MLRVYTRGYNMPSRWDYCRLKAILRTRRVINVTLGAKGDYFFLFDLGFRFFAFDLVFDLPDDCLEEVLELPAFDFDFDLSFAFAFAFDLCFAFDLVFVFEFESPERWPVCFFDRLPLFDSSFERDFLPDFVFFSDVVEGRREFNSNSNIRWSGSMNATLTDTRSPSRNWL